MKNTLQDRNWISRMRLTAASAALALAVVLVSAVITTQPAQAQTYTVLASFDGTNGNYPLAPLVQATNGNLYGTTEQNGFSYGSVFEVTTSGTLTSLHSFCSQGGYPNCPDGDFPVAGLVQATNGDLYGTTEYGGSPDGSFGTVFQIKITPSFTLTTLDSFPVEDGCAPEPTAGLVQATNGDLYGTTPCGGVNGGGTVFQITPAGTLTTKYNFCPIAGISGCGNDQPTYANGFDPVAGLIQATNGDLYGTTVSGGINGGGTVFKITTGGKLTTLYSFCSQVNGSGTCTDGGHPSSVLVQATNGDIYGTTAYGGTGAACPDVIDCGTIFEITPTGALTTLYSFCSQSGCADGANQGNLETPQPALIQATDGNLYGTTPFGGYTTSGVNTNGYGTIFEITPSGTLTTLYTFCEVSGCPDGADPFAGLIQDTNGNFYGTTSSGVTGNPCYEYGCGTVFSLSTGLGPFVTTRPASAAVGKAVTILGTDLTGATGVSFNGTPQLTFTVVSSSEITTTVPTGATAGYVTVTTTFGEAVTFTATVSSNAGSPPNGETVSFQKGATVLGTGTLSSGSASFTTSTLPVGTTSVKAVYGGDAYFHSITSNVVKQVVDKAAN